jgi:hypothetical protein
MTIEEDRIMYDLEYAAYNLCTKTDSDVGRGVIESTCPEATLLLAIRRFSDLCKANNDRLNKMQALIDGTVSNMQTITNVSGDRLIIDIATHTANTLMNPDTWGNICGGEE